MNVCALPFCPGWTVQREIMLSKIRTQKPQIYVVNWGRKQLTNYSTNHYKLHFNTQSHCQKTLRTTLFVYSNQQGIAIMMNFNIWDVNNQPYVCHVGLFSETAFSDSDISAQTCIMCHIIKIKHHYHFHKHKQWIPHKFKVNSKRKSDF